MYASAGSEMIADARLDRFERRQQQVTLAARRVTAARDVSGRVVGALGACRRRSSGPQASPTTASTAARSAGDGSGAMTCRSIAPECSPAG